MSAAANAAGYLYAQGRLPSRPLEPKVVASQGQSQPVKQYRRRRFYPLPSVA